MTVVLHEAQRLSHWASPPTCCQPRPFHPQSTRSHDRRCACVVDHAAATAHVARPAVRDLLIGSCKWGTPLGDLVLSRCPPFSRLSSSLQLKHTQTNSRTQHGQHRNGKAALPVTEKQTHWGTGMTGIISEFLLLDVRNLIGLSQVSSCFMAPQKLSWTEEQKKAAAVVCCHLGCHQEPGEESYLA